MKISDFKLLANTQLEDNYSHSERQRILSILIEERLSLSRLDLIKKGDFEIDKKVEQVLIKDLQALADDVPIQHLLEKVEFFGLQLKLSNQVLIPRDETEELVSLIAADYHNIKTPEKIIDFGTGSACIALSMAKCFPNAKVIAWDLSVEALALAKSNAKRNNLTVHFEQRDILSAGLEDAKIDLMISNPPYIPPSQKYTMDQSVLKHEPSLALFVDEDKPLLFYQRITALAMENLKKGGRLYFEINQLFAEETLNLIPTSIFNADLLKDMNGNWRFIRAEKKA